MIESVLTIAASVGAISAAVGLIMNVFRLKKNNVQQRRMLVASYLKEFSEDEGMQKIFYAIDYDEFMYSVEFHGSDEELGLDRLLRHFANLALSWRGGLLTIEDICPIQYYILNIMDNSGVSEYMGNIRYLSEKRGFGQHPFVVLGELGEALNSGRRCRLSRIPLFRKLVCGRI